MPTLSRPCSGRWLLLLAIALSSLCSIQADPPVVVPWVPAVRNFDASVLPNPASLPFPSGCANPGWTSESYKTCLMPRINGQIYDGPRHPSWDPMGSKSRWKIMTDRNTTPIVGIHVAQVPGTNEYLFIGRSSELSFDEDGDVVAGLYTQTTQTFRNVSSTTNAFCNGLAITHDGRVMTAGGTTAERPGGKPDGRRKVRLYDLKANPLMLPDTVDMRYDRWYPTAILLADNTMFIMGGTKTATERSSPNNWFEKWDPANPTQFPLARYPIEPTFLPQMGKQFYPSMYVLPTSEVFVLSDQHSRIIKPDGSYRMVTDASGATKPLVPPLYPSRWKTQFPHIGTASMGALTWENDYGSVDIIMQGGSPFPDTDDVQLWCPSINNTAKTTPANPYSYKITISFKYENGDWRYTFSDWLEEDMGVPRVGGDSVLLPNGDTVTLGGAQTGCSCGIRSGVNRGNYPALWPVLYQPDRPVGKRYTVMSASSIARMYHGTALLTASGTIMVAGCDACEKKTIVTTAPWWSGSPDRRWEFRVEEFSPPYVLDNKAKPKITAINSATPAMSSLAYGQNFTITWAPEMPLITDVNVTSVSLVAPCAVTHGLNMNQRVVFLKIVSRTDNTVTVHVPSTVAILPPQIYKVHIMNGKTYSKAWWVKLTKPVSATKRLLGATRKHLQV